MSFELFLAVAVGFGLAVLIGAVATIRSTLREPRAAKTNVRGQSTFDVAQVDFLEILTWTVARPLLSSARFETVEATDATSQAWVDEDSLLHAREEVAASGKSFRPACALKRFARLTGAGGEAAGLRLEVVRDSYGDYVAIRSLLQAPSQIDAARSFISRNDVEEIVERAPLSVIGVNITVTSEDHVLLMQRSNQVVTFRGFWQAGPHTSMGFVDDKPESALELAKRALYEEVGLLSEDYDDRIVFSWFGMYIPEATPYLFGHVKTVLTRGEVEERILRAPAANETFDGGREVAWIVPSHESLEQVARAVGSSDDEPALGGRTFLPHAAVGLRNLTRVLELLDGGHAS